MPRRTLNRLLTYPDGICRICTVRDRKITGTRYTLRFGEETVGVVRFWNAQIASSRIDRLVRVPYGPEISQRDLVVIGDRQYSIRQLQVKDHGDQRYLLLSLESVQTPYQEAQEVTP